MLRMLKTLGIEVKESEYKSEGLVLYTVELTWATINVKVTLKDKAKTEKLALKLFIEKLQRSNLLYCPECGQVNKQERSAGI